MRQVMYGEAGQPINLSRLFNASMVSIGCRFTRAMAIGIGSEPATWHLAFLRFVVWPATASGCDDSYIWFDDGGEVM